MIAIIDYGLGNLASVLNVFEAINIEAEITNDIEKIRKADKIILPGVGAFKEGMKNLKELGLVDVLHEEVIIKKKPFLGICLGMQLICTKGYEGGEEAGLGWIDAEVVRFDSEELRVPHMGWNDVKCNTSSPIFKESNETQTFYFVHSFYVKPNEESISIGTCDYGQNFAAVIQKGNIFATQFHPEKSQFEGVEILRKFAELGGGI
jgi:imidazole glycerol-phosphate synthase subunit HisH